jgi:N-acetylglutamate synthase-like GNAT family acetyltransferase
VEKDFYLDEFHEKSLLFAIRSVESASEEELTAALEVVRTLLTNETMVLLLIETPAEAAQQKRLRPWLKQILRLAKTPAATLTSLQDISSDEELLIHIWVALRDGPLFVGLCPADTKVSFVTYAQQIAVSLRVYKLVFLDKAGGLVTTHKRVSFLNGPVLQELLRPGEAEWAGLGERRSLLEAIHLALAGGVTSVSLCRFAELGRELFTYEGCGTLFTLTDYCHVEKLGIDDFHEVEKLLQRGEREGHLKPRTPLETAQLLLYGYGARLGPAPGELAGFCALLPYKKDMAAEIVGLSTITRYQGEGIGGRLVDHMVLEGKQQGLSYLFACTTQDGAQRLFERHGFRRVVHDAVSEAKWRGYAPERKQCVAVFRRDLQLPDPQEGANT